MWVLTWGLRLLYTQAVTQIFPQGILELCALVSMYSIRATKLGNESLQDGVGRRGCFFIGNGHGSDKFVEAVLYRANMAQTLTIN